MEPIMSTDCYYLYGVVGAPSAANLGPIGLDGEAVYTVVEGGLGVVAGPARRLDFAAVAPGKTLQYLAQHQRVLEQVMAGSTVIPLKFGTYAADARQVLEVLRAGRHEFTGALAKYAGKAEVDLAAFWTDLPAVLAEIAREPGVVALKAQIAGQAAVTLEERVRLGQEVKKLLDARRTRAAAELTAALRTRWPDLLVNPPTDDAMIFSAAILTGQAEQDQLEEAIRAFDRRYEDRMKFRYVGPLPPYSFATAEVRTLGAEDLEGARRVLGLEGSFSCAQAKSAYRRLLQELHPDRNPDARAADRLKAAGTAYEMLEDYALNYQHALPAGQKPAVLVKVRSLDDLRAAARTPARGGVLREPGRLEAEAA
jgi:hypothetical protein